MEILIKRVKTWTGINEFLLCLPEKPYTYGKIEWAREHASELGYRPLSGDATKGVLPAGGYRADEMPGEEVWTDAKPVEVELSKIAGDVTNEELESQAKEAKRLMEIAASSIATLDGERANLFEVHSNAQVRFETATRALKLAKGE